MKIFPAKKKCNTIKTMTKQLRLFLVIGSMALFTSVSLLAQAGHVLTIKANDIKATVQPTMWGVFFEDINMGADGGIYAELVKNRSFEFYRPMMGWKVLGKPQTEGDFLILNRHQTNTANPRFLRVSLNKNVKGSLGLNNEGFRGMGIKNNVQYDFSIMYRSATVNNKMYVELLNSKGESIGSTSFILKATGDEWKKISADFMATATEPKAKLNIWF
jgi:hypothetical protein